MRKGEAMQKNVFEKGFSAKRDSDSVNASLNAEESLGKFDSSAPLLSCRDLTKHYGNKKALSLISFDAASGKIIGLFGPNGSGKSTFIKLIAGLLTKDSGEILVMGKRCGVEAREKISYLPERNSLPLHFTVADAIGFYEDFFSDFDKERAKRVIDDFSINQNHRIKALSKGEREKLSLTLTMSRNAKLFILDEPISGVDPAARDYIIDTVLRNKPEGSSVIIATHFISDIERIMDEFVFMKYGEIYARSTPKEIREKYGKSVDEYFREVFRC